MTLTHANRSIECSDAVKSIGNGHPMKKYVGAMVRWSFQLAIGAEQDHFENKSSCTKKTQLPGTLKKTKLYCNVHSIPLIYIGKPTITLGNRAETGNIL